MIILHENLTREAEDVAEKINEVFGIQSSLASQDLGSVFDKIDQFDGYLNYSKKLHKLIDFYGDGNKVLVLTDRDIYINNKSRDDDWIFGYYYKNIILVSTARLKKHADALPSLTLEVPLAQYLRRIEHIAIHEVGHAVVKAKHYKTAYTVNVKTGYKLNLGPHCTDNTCVMYEINGIRTPSRDDCYMLVGREKKFDVGLDEVLERINPLWFCDKCRTSIVVDKSYW